MRVTDEMFDRAWATLPTKAPIAQPEWSRMLSAALEAALADVPEPSEAQRRAYKTAEGVLHARAEKAEARVETLEDAHDELYSQFAVMETRALRAEARVQELEAEERIWRGHNCAGAEAARMKELEAEVDERHAKLVEVADKLSESRGSGKEVRALMIELEAKLAKVRAWSARERLEDQHHRTDFDALDAILTSADSEGAKP